MERYQSAAVAKIGNRPRMEDVYLIAHDLGLDSALKVSLYSVIDGHGGEWCSKFLQTEMVRYVIQEFKQSLSSPVMIRQQLKRPAGQLVASVFNRAYQKLDLEYYLRNDLISKQSGAVVVTVFIMGTTIFCINLGDCRAVISRNGQAISLSIDHKATFKREQQRVWQQGGYIFGGRLAGKLAITRSFGDFALKVHKDEGGKNYFKNYLSNEPEVRFAEMDILNDEFMIIASDGLFDRFTSQQVCDMVRHELAKLPPGRKDLKKIASIILQRTLDVKKDETVKDNVTCLLIALKKL